MKNGNRFVLFSVSLLFVLFAPSLAQAQKAALGAAPSAQPRRSISPVAPVHSGSGHAATGKPKAASGQHSHTSAKSVDMSKWDPRAFGSILPPAPGPGFEYGYLNGLNGGFGSGDRRRNGAGQNSPGFGSGFYLLTGGGGYADPTEDSSAPAAADTQAQEGTPEQGNDRSNNLSNDQSNDQGPNQEPSQEPNQENDQRQPRYIILQQAPAPRQPESQESAATLTPDEGEFTLVLRNGTSISTAAFTHSNEKFIYISPDGGRRTVAASDVDADATVRVNQERGIPLRLPL
jgi:hypothetical protein